MCNQEKKIKNKKGIVIIQSPRTSGQPAAALTETSRAICLKWDFEGTEISQREKCRC
jgi:hypothetical protein